MRATRSLRVAVVILAAAGVPARAQDGHGFLFGAGGSNGNSRNSLSILLDVSASSISDSGLGPQSTVGDADFLVRGFTSQWVATADYTRSRRRTQLQANAVTSFRYSSSLDRVSPVSHSGSLSWAVRLPWRSSLALSSAIAYAPAYLYQLFPTASAADAVETIPANPDYQIFQNNSYTYAGRATYRIGAASAPHVMASVDHAHTTFEGDFLKQPNLSTSDARVQFTDPVSSRIGWSVEYGHNTSTYGVNGGTAEDRFLGSIDYAHALSRTRLAKFSLSVGPGILRVPDASIFAGLPSLVPAFDGTASGQTIRVYQLETDAGIDVDFGRRLHSSVNFRRGVEYVALLTEPVFANALNVETSGLITRRVDWSASAGYANGATALDESAKGLSTTTMQVRTRFAVSRSFATYAQYLHYSYNLNDQIGIAPGLPNVFGRHEVRFGGMLVVRPIHTASRGSAR